MKFEHVEREWILTKRVGNSPKKKGIEKTGCSNDGTKRTSGMFQGKYLQQA